MARPVKWARDLHAIRDRAMRSRTETWSRQDIEQLFGTGRASAQNLMKAIGGVQLIGGTHFVDRTSLLSFLDEMIAAASVEEALRSRLLEAPPAPKPKALRVSLPDGLCHAMLPDLPGNVTLSPGKIVITADSAVGMVEALLALAMVMQNDLARWEAAVRKQSTPAGTLDGELRLLITKMRANTKAQSVIAI